MRPFDIELTHEGIEAFLLLQAVGARRSGCFLLEGKVHALMTSVLLRVTRLDAFDRNAEAKPPDRPRATEIEGAVLFWFGADFSARVGV